MSAPKLKLPLFHSVSPFWVQAMMPTILPVVPLFLALNFQIL